MDLSVYSKYLNRIYNDMVSVKRSVSVSNSDGSEDTIYKEVDELQNIPCHYSIGSMDEVDMSEDDKNTIITKHTLFLATNHEIKAGDLLTILHKGRVIELVAALPEITDLCQQIVTIEKRYA